MSRSSRILLISNLAWNLAHFRRPLIETLLSDGHEVIAAAVPDGHEAALTAMGAQFEPLRMKPGGISPIADLSLLVSLRRLIRRRAPDAVMTFTIKPNVYGSLAAASADVPAYPTISGLGSSFIAGGVLGTVAAGLFRVALAKVRVAIFQNGDDRDLFVRRKLVDESQTALVPGSGVDLDRYRPAPLPDSPFTFLMIGRLLRDKGVVEYAEAGRLLKARGLDVRLRILGAVGVDNPSAVPIEAVARYVADGSFEHLELTDDVRPAIAASHVVVLPSYREGVPMSLLEASAMARPLVASDVPGCREVVEDSVNGFLCDARDAVSLADAMERMIMLDRCRLEAMGMSARQRVADRFASEKVTNAYREVLAS